MKRYSRYLIVILCITAMVLGMTSCAAKTSAPEISEVEEERKLKIYTSHNEEVYSPIIKEFEDRTGIVVEVVEGGTADLLEKIDNADESYCCDVMFGGGIESISAYSECFEPYSPKGSNMIANADSCSDGTWTAFTELPIVIIYNNKLVAKQDAPNGWKRLFDKKWKGYIAFANPMRSESSYTILYTLLQSLRGENEDNIKDFVDMLEGDLSPTAGDVIGEVSTGARLVGITFEETARKAVDKEYNISYLYPMEGTSVVPDAAAIVKGAEHIENAKLFMDFIIGEDVQKFAEDVLYRRSVRTDIQEQLHDAPLRLVRYDIEEASENKEEILRLWDKYFSESEFVYGK